MALSAKKLKLKLKYEKLGTPSGCYEPHHIICASAQPDLGIGQPASQVYLLGFIDRSELRRLLSSDLGN